MNSTAIFKAIKIIYPQIEGGYTYWENQANPADGLIWENKIFPKPKWQDIEKLIPEIELQNAKEAKLAEINSFHDSKEVKYLTIKVGSLQTGIFVNQEYRYLIDEQRELLQIRKDAGETNPTWLYQNGITLPLDLKTLNQIRLYIGKLTDDNFRARANNIKAISAFKTIEELDKFDIKTGYRINQILTF